MEKQKEGVMLEGRVAMGDTGVLEPVRLIVSSLHHYTTDLPASPSP